MRRGVVVDEWYPYYELVQTDQMGVSFFVDVSDELTERHDRIVAEFTELQSELGELAKRERSNAKGE